MFIRGSLIASILLLLGACSINDDDGARCAINAANCADSSNFAASAFFCKATPVKNPIAVGELVTVNLSAWGGTAPYRVPTPSGGKKFNSSTTVRGGFTTAGEKSETISVFDSEASLATCELRIRVE